MARVFVSYQQEDRDRAEPIVEALKRAGVEVWWDPSIQPGAEFSEEITTALADAAAVLVLWSAHSVGSRWVKDEAERGAERRVLVPARIDAVQPPMGFRQFQTLDLSSWNGDADNPAFQRLLATLRTLLAGIGRAQPMRARASGEVGIGVAVFGGRYVLVKVAGETAKCVVYKSWDRKEQRYVALKVPRTMRVAQAAAQVRHEARSALGVNHPNVCGILEARVSLIKQLSAWFRPRTVGQAGGETEVFGGRMQEIGERISAFLVMPFLEGRTLDVEAFDRRGQPIAVKSAVDILAQACAGLQHIHDRGIVFRDVKLENIMLVPAGGTHRLAVVFDFDMALPQGSVPKGGLATGDMVAGTPQFVSPEQVRGGPLDHRSDIYQLGLVAYEVLTGSLPFAGGTDQETMLARLTEHPVHPKERRGDLPDGLATTILKCLEPEPAARFPSMKDLEVALRGSLVDE